MPCAVRLSCLENAHSHPLFQRAILTRQVGHDLGFSMQSGFISRSVYARLQVSACRGYDLCTLVNVWTYRQHFHQLIWI